MRRGSGRRNAKLFGKKCPADTNRIEVGMHLRREMLGWRFEPANDRKAAWASQGRRKFVDVHAMTISEFTNCCRALLMCAFETFKCLDKFNRVVVMPRQKQLTSMLLTAFGPLRRRLRPKKVRA